MRFNEINWDNLFGAVDESLFTSEQINELKLGQDADLPIQVYADPRWSPEEMKTMRCMMETIFFALQHPQEHVVCTEYGPEKVDFSFRSQTNFEKHPDWICYIPEDWDFEEDGPGYTGRDIVHICDDDPLKAHMVFSLCSWQHPETVLGEWDEDDEIALMEFRSKAAKHPALEERIRKLSAVAQKGQSHTPNEPER